MSDLSERAQRLLAAMASSPSIDENRLEETRRLLSVIDAARDRAAAQVDDLIALERRLREAGEAPLSFGFNVIPFRGPERRFERELSRRSNATPLLLVCACETTVRRAAFEAHALSGRWAFLDFEDLERGCLETDGGLSALSGATVFVRDLGALTIAAQDAIARRWREGRMDQAPFIVAAAAGASSDASGALLSLFEIKAVRPGGTLSPARAPSLQPSLHS